jgi:hypothetical protein
VSFLYWVYDLACGSEVNSGYVGVTENPYQRLHSLRSQGTVPRNAIMRILFEGTRQECLAKEKTLRPQRNIGWNKAIGGVAARPSKYGLSPIGTSKDAYGRDLLRDAA